MDDDGTLSERNVLRFLTAVAIYEDDGYFAQLALGDDPMEPKNYVTLQSINVITEQDLSLELDGIFIECSAGLDGYDLVSSISRTADTVEIGLHENKAGLARISVILTDECRAALEESNGVEIFQERLARPRVLPS